MTIFVPSHLEIKKSNYNGKGIFAKISLKKGQTIFTLAQNTTVLSNANASINAIQIDEDLYLDPQLHFWRFWNHSCEPNTTFDVEKFQIMAIKDIAIGEEITYHYCTTEFDLLIKNEHFQCHCGSKNCIRIVSGFKHISPELKTNLRPYLASYLKKTSRLTLV